jgi:hypothetical protein
MARRQGGEPLALATRLPELALGLVEPECKMNSSDM